MIEPPSRCKLAPDAGIQRTLASSVRLYQRWSRLPQIGISSSKLLELLFSRIHFSWAAAFVIFVATFRFVQAPLASQSSPSIRNRSSQIKFCFVFKLEQSASERYSGGAATRCLGQLCPTQMATVVQGAGILKMSTVKGFRTMDKRMRCNLVRCTM